MAQSRPAAAMDPPHITEFASERYFEKLNQLNATQPQPQPHLQHQTLEHPESSAASTFILPVRDSKNAEHEKRDKGRFLGIRHKVSLLHSKASPYEHESIHTSHSRASTESTRRSVPFDQLFLALPNELQAQILSSLPLTDILNLRLTSKSWHILVTLNESPIVRYHLDNHVPAYALRLYPVIDPNEINLHFLCSIWHRLHVAAKLSFLICEWITKDIFLRQTEAQRIAFAPQHERMRRRLIPLLFTIFHFFETYRQLHLQHIMAHDGHGLHKEPYTVNPIEKRIMDMYDDQTLLRVHEVFPLVVSSFCRRLRPPTYVGRVERSLRGYLRDRPSDDVHSAILCIGGLRQVERLWETKGYSARRASVDTWYNGLTKEVAGEGSNKLRLGLKSFGRKKSSNEKQSFRLSAGDGAFRTKLSPEGMEGGNADGYFDSNWIFNTSLAADRPMAPPSKEHAQILLNDLPVLQQIWLTTAEALILDRGIVQRTQDIKRNQQVMLDLIREDGMDEANEWWYARSMRDSIRPAVGATDDDAD
ncbi:hypothetical protein HIM_01245 [Hirsutella minnesotensis 3608]|nr:hypothetical protein HIM_01245 [Hirsutella minnesotensis 3608]